MSAVQPSPQRLAGPRRESTPRETGGAEPAARRNGGGLDSERLSVLLERARDNDRDSLAEIVAMVTPVLWQVARAQGLDRDTAEDVVQTTWLALLKHLHDIRTPAALTGWLVTVVKRESWRVCRARRGEQLVEEWPANLASETEPAPEAAVIDAERRSRLWTLVRQLPQRCQRLLRIVAVTPRPDYAEISKTLGMPHGSLGPTRGRCLAKLRHLMEIDPTWSSR